MAALFTGLSWRNIHHLKEELFARAMIRWQYSVRRVFNHQCQWRDPVQLQKRIADEKRWFVQSCLILAGFFVSLLPIFVLYLSSCCSKLTLKPIFNLLVWILFFSGASFNFVIYNFLNQGFRRRFCQIFCFNRKSGSLKLNTASKTESTRQTVLSKE